MLSTPRVGLLLETQGVTLCCEGKEPSAGSRRSLGLGFGRW